MKTKDLDYEIEGERCAIKNREGESICYLSKSEARKIGLEKDKSGKETEEK